MTAIVDGVPQQRMDGISMRIARQYQITNDTVPCRIDVLYGYKAIRLKQRKPLDRIQA